jgi:hypothetical protein
MKKQLILVSTLFLISNCIYSQISSPCFNPVVNYSTSSNATAISLTTADFNSDGNKDIAIANFQLSNVSVMLGFGNGIFSPAVNYTVGTNPYSVTVGDFNTDGKMDLVTANWGSANISVLFGNGNGTFGSAIPFSAGTNPRSITTGDLNGDSKLDLAVVNASSDDVSILIGNGLGSFASTVNYTVGSSPTSVSTKDLNNDGKLDLVVTNAGTNDISILLGNGLGAFPSSTSYNTGTTPYSSTIADFNGDGKLDIAICNISSNNVSVFIGNGLGAFALVNNYFVDNGPFTITTEDFNNDGKIDLATSNFTSSDVSIILGNGNATFGSPFNYIVGQGASSIVTSDFNNDGKIDIATANQTGNNASILINSFPIVTVNSGTICSGNTFTISPSGASFYSYSGGSNMVNPTLNISYTVTGTNAVGCISTAVSNVTVLPTPIVSVNGGSVCIGNTFSITPSGASSYTFSGGTANVNPTVTTNYTVTGASSNGCSNKAVSSVIVYPLPTLVAGSTNSITCPGQLAILSVNGANSYTWSNGSQLSTIGVSPTITTTYSVIGTSIYGCQNSASTTQSVAPCVGLNELVANNTIFNLYPNPTNGLFYVELASSVKITITNTLGEIVFEELMEVGKHQLSIQDQASGMYFIKAFANNQTQLYKLIKD